MKIIFLDIEMHNNEDTNCSNVTIIQENMIDTSHNDDSTIVVDIKPSSEEVKRIRQGHNSKGYAEMELKFTYNLFTRKPSVQLTSDVSYDENNNPYQLLVFPYGNDERCGTLAAYIQVQDHFYAEILHYSHFYFLMVTGDFCFFFL